MIDTIYIEAALEDHPRVTGILKRYPNARRITCERYGEVFNPKAQNFRLQKKKPALILAQKHKGFVLPAPDGYGIGGAHNYYFSHMLNCLYDCRYCFLQGMYRSANYILFVNYEDFDQAIRLTASQHPGQSIHFFSGYDCDSLAFENTSGFAAHILPLFRERPHTLLELRTKSTQISTLLETEAIDNVVVAYSLNPDNVAKSLEHGAPGLSARIRAMLKLAESGWKIGLRFDPLIYQSHYQTLYRELFKQVFSVLPERSIHSVSTGPFRLPDGFFKKLIRLYPDEKLFAGPLSSDNGMTSYDTALEEEMIAFCKAQILNYIPEEKFFRCTL